MNLAKISVVIPSWNRKEDLQRALKSLQSQSYKDFEIIVIDNGSKDGTVEMVNKEFPKVILQKNPENLGTSIAKNQGILLAKGEYILFLDSDIEMTHKDCIKNMASILTAHPQIGAVGGEAYKTPSGVITKRKDITLNCETSTFIMPNKEYQLHPCGYVATCNCMMRKKDLGRCKGFDNKIMYAGEDKEMGYKLRQFKLRSVIDSRCLVYHYVSDSGRASKFYAFHKNRLRIILKNYPWIVLPFIPVLDLVSFVSPKKLKELKENNRDVTKWVSAKEKQVKKYSTLKKILIVGFDYLFSLLKAYLWNLVHLPETLYIRLKKHNNLEEVKQRWL